MIWKSKREKTLLSTVPATIETQMMGIMEIEKDKFGSGITYIMVSAKAFESPWIKGYICGWTEGYLRGASVQEKYFARAVRTSLEVMNRWVHLIYLSQGMEINWLAVVSAGKNRSLYHESYLDGLEDGLEVGKQINAFLEDSAMPSREGICFKKLFEKIRLGNSLVVLALIDEAQNGDAGAKELLSTLDVKL